MTKDFLRQMEEGVEKTTHEWAMYYGVSEDKVKRTASQLRRQGHMVFSMLDGSRYVYRLVTRKKEWAVKTLHQYIHNHAMPLISRVSTLANQTVTLYPDTKEDVLYPLKSLADYAQKQHDHIVLVTKAGNKITIKYEQTNRETTNVTKVR